MGIRTGQQYLDKLNSMTPHVMIDGEMVTAKDCRPPVLRQRGTHVRQAL